FVAPLVDVGLPLLRRARLATCRHGGPGDEQRGSENGDARTRSHQSSRMFTGLRCRVSAHASSFAGPSAKEGGALWTPPSQTRAYDLLVLVDVPNRVASRLHAQDQRDLLHLVQRRPRPIDVIGAFRDGEGNPAIRFGQLSALDDLFDQRPPAND